MSHSDRHEGSAVPSDPQLRAEQDRIARVRSGDEAAFRELYIEYYPGLVTFVTGLLGSLGAAEDVVQTLFSNLWDQRTTWSPARIAPYLYRAARHRAIDELRRAHRAEEHAQSAADNMSDWHGVAPSQADVAAEAHDLERLLAQAITALPKRRRIALMLRVVQGMSYAEIGTVLNVSEKAAFILVARAKEALQPIRDLYLQDDEASGEGGTG